MPVECHEIEVPELYPGTTFAWVTDDIIVLNDTDVDGEQSSVVLVLGDPPWVAPALAGRRSGSDVAVSSGGGIIASERQSGGRRDPRPALRVWSGCAPTDAAPYQSFGSGECVAHAVSPCGRWVAAVFRTAEYSGADWAVSRVYDTETGDLLWNQSVLAPDGDIRWSGRRVWFGDDGDGYFVNFFTGGVGRSSERINEIWDVVWGVTADNTVIVSDVDDERTLVQEVSIDRVDRVVLPITGEECVDDVALFQDRTRCALAVAGWANGAAFISIHTKDASGTMSWSCVAVVENLPAPIERVAWSRSGRRLAASVGGRLHVWDVVDDRPQSVASLDLQMSQLEQYLLRNRDAIQTRINHHQNAQTITTLIRILGIIAAAVATVPRCLTCNSPGCRAHGGYARGMDLGRAAAAVSSAGGPALVDLTALDPAVPIERGIRDGILQTRAAAVLDVQTVRPMEFY